LPNSVHVAYPCAAVLPFTCCWQIAGRFWADAVDAYKAGNLAGLRVSGCALTGLLSDMDDLLASHKAFLLGLVLQRARSYAGSSLDAASVAAAAAAGGAGAASDDNQQLHKCGSTSSTDTGRSLQSSSTAVACAAGSAAGSGQQHQLAALYEWNMRTQLTIWGTSAVAGDSEVSDYANKEWSGLIASFYLPRWQAWLARLEQDLLQGRPYDAAAWRLEVLMMTYRWISTGSTSGSSSQAEPMAVDAVPGAQDADAGLTFGTAAATAVGDVALAPRGDAVQLSSKAYERYGRLLAPGCSATAATAAAAVAAAAAGLAAAAAVPAGAPAGTVVAAAAAAAVVVGAAGAAAAAVAAAGTGPLPIAVDAAKA
jgi:hypothetical protein